MLKKAFLSFIVLTLLITIFIPTALAEDPLPKSTEPQVTDLPATPATGGDNIPEEVKYAITHQKFPDLGDNVDTSFGVPEGGADARSIPTTGPKKYTKTLTLQSYTYEGETYEYYSGYILYTPLIGGFCTFYSLTNEDTDIAYIDAYHTDPIKVDEADGPFSTWFNLNGARQYAIMFINWDSPSLTYLMTTATEVHNTALKISPNGFSKNWLQALRFYTDNQKNFYIHITFPEGSTCNLDLFNVTTYANGDFNITDVLGEYKTFSGDCYYHITGNGKSHDIMMELSNASSTTAAFTVALDSTEYRTAGMSEGVVYDRELKVNDTFTADYFIPAKTGNYKLTSDRSDSKITVVSEAGQATGDYVVTNAAPDTIVSLEAGTKYFMYYTTNGTAGRIHYSAVYVPSVECSLLGIGSPFNLVLNNRVVTAAVENDVTSQLVGGVSISDKAEWKLYSDLKCTSEITDKTMALSEGLNRSYLKVTAEDGIHNTVYPVFVYRLSPDTEPSILAFDSEYTEIISGTATNPCVNMVLLGKAELNPVVTYNGSPFDWSDQFTEQGSYEVNVFDGNGHIAGPFEFTIDKLAPVLTVRDAYNASVTNGALLNSTVTVSASDDTQTSCSATKDGSEYLWPDGGVFTESGVYSVTVTDAAGNSSSYTFTIDVSAPDIKAVCGIRTLASDDHANGNVTVTVTDPHFRSKSLTKNGLPAAWPSGGIFTYAGTYAVTASDTLNNAAAFTFTIDLTKPVVTAKANGYSISSGTYTKYDVTVSVSDANLDTKTVTKNNEAYDWPSDNKFIEQGAYKLTVADKAGNTVVFTFTIDTTAPSITAVSGDPIISGACLNTDVTVSVDDTNLYGKYAKKNGSSIPWPSGGMFTLTGSYVVTAKDKAGYTATFSFVIDKIKPVISVKTTSGSTVPSGGATKYDVYAKVSDTYLISKTITLNGDIIAWPATNKFTQEGVYKVNATDKAGNSATEYEFTIDKPARFTVTESISGETIANKGFANEAASLVFEEQFYFSKAITQDGVLMGWSGDIPGIFLLSEGVYVASVKDIIGNTSTFTFTIDRTAPVISAKTTSGAIVGNTGATKESSVTVSVTEKYLASKTATKNGVKISWPYGGKFTYEGVYVITAADKAGNSAAPFTFTIDRSKPVITCKTATPPQKNITSGATVKDSVVITVTDRIGVSKTLTKNSSVIAWPENNTVTEDGVYTVSSTNDLGYVSSTFIFTIDTVNPMVTAKNSSGANILHCGYSSSDVTVSANEPAKMSVTKNSAGIAYPTGGVFKAAGTYLVTAQDAAGNKGYLQFTIDKTAPVLTAVGIGGTKITNGSFTAGNVTLTVTGWDNGYVNKDDYTSLNFSAGGVLDLTEEGKYYADVYDWAGNHTTLLFYIDRNPPEIDADIFSGPFSGGITCHDVTVTAEDTVTPATNMTYIVKKDGISSSYPENGNFRTEGAYEVTAKDGAGHSSSTFTFTIDRTKPVITAVDKDMVPVDDTDSSQRDVTVTITDNFSNVPNLVIYAEWNNSQITYPANGVFSAEGFYWITATDEAGYITAFSFTIDKTVPVVIAVLTSNTSTWVTDNSTVTEGVSLYFQEANISTSTVTVMRNNEVYKKYPITGGESPSLLWYPGDFPFKLDLTQSGVYIYTITDKAGNQGSITFTIQIPS